MNDRGYDDRPVHELSAEELREQAEQACFDSGYYAGVMNKGASWQEYEPLLTTARDRRNECFEELKRRLENAMQLGGAVTMLLRHREAGNEHPIDWQRLIEAKEASDG